MTRKKIKLVPKQETKGRRTLNILSLGVLLLAGFVLALFGYWAVSGRDVLEVKNAPVPIRTLREHAEADGVVILKVNYCKKIKAKGKVRTSFVGVSREVFLPLYEDAQTPQCQEVELPVLIPKDLPVGKYHVHFRVAYTINPIRTVVEEFDSQEFELVASDGNKAIPGTQME